MMISRKRTHQPEKEVDEKNANDEPEVSKMSSILFSHCIF